MGRQPRGAGADRRRADSREEDLVYRTGEEEEDCGPEAMCGGLDSISSTMGGDISPDSGIRRSELGPETNKKKSRGCANWCGTLGPRGQAGERGSERGTCNGWGLDGTPDGKKSPYGDRYEPSSRAANVLQERERLRENGMIPGELRERGIQVGGMHATEDEVRDLLESLEGRGHEVGDDDEVL